MDTATKIAHTPGPWTFDPIGDDLKGDPEFPHCDDAAFWIAEDCHAGEVLAVAIRMPKDEPATKANARLIAAAPDLLAAAQRALAIEESVTQGQERELREGYVALLRAAIEKADGR